MLREDIAADNHDLIYGYLPPEGYLFIGMSGIDAKPR